MMNTSDATYGSHGGTLGGGKFGIQRHDAISTPDGKYAIISLYYVDNATDTGLTSGVQLYDIANKQFVSGIIPKERRERYPTPDRAMTSGFLLELQRFVKTVPAEEHILMAGALSYSLLNTSF